VTKRYGPPATPCDRMIRHEAASAAAKMKLIEHPATLDPVALLHTIREAWSALTAIVSPEIRPAPRGVSLERFLARLPDRWREEQAPTDREPRVKSPRHRRTRKNPFEGGVGRRGVLVAGLAGCNRQGTFSYGRVWAELCHFRPPGRWFRSGRLMTLCPFLAELFRCTMPP